MPGNSVKYPENAMRTWYQERLAGDGLAECRFRVSSLKLNLPGCYRPLLAIPHNLSYQLQRAACTHGTKKQEESGTESLSLNLNFDLDSSCYATICLREIMKCETWKQKLNLSFFISTVIVSNVLMNSSMVTDVTKQVLIAYSEKVRLTRSHLNVKRFKFVLCAVIREPASIHDF